MEQEGTRQQQVDILNLGLGDNPAQKEDILDHHKEDMTL